MIDLSNEASIRIGIETLISMNRPGLEMFAIRQYYRYRDRPFLLRSLYEIADELSMELDSEESLSSCGLAVQVPVANAIAVFVVRSAAVSGEVAPATVRHSFGGLEYERLSQAAMVQSGVRVDIYLRICKIEDIPSVVTIDGGVVTKNNYMIWSDAYIFRMLTSEFSRKAKEIEAPPSDDVVVNTRIEQRIVIGVPIYNSPQYFCRLFESLQLSLVNTDGDISIVVLDDGSDSYSRGRLKESVSRLNSGINGGVKVFHKRNRSNIGFIKTCNKLFNFDRSADVFILLTTDVVVPRGWLRRAIEPFNSSPDIALASPLAVNGANLDVEVPRGMSWLDADSLSRLREASYPDAETTVGYCMAVRPSALESKEELFSTHFENGYGDDSDLYYRLIARGYRGVAIDNMIVYHAGGGSFDNLADAQRLRADNFRRFSDDWMSVYLDRIEEMARPLARIRANIGAALPRRRSVVDVLFVLPTDNRRIGGVESVMRIAEQLQRRGVSAHVLCTSTSPAHAPTAGEYKPLSLRELGGDISRVIERTGVPRAVVATSHDTVSWVRALGRSASSALWYFVQGPEMAFSAGAHSASVVRELAGFDRTLCVSSYLCDLVSLLGGSKAEVIPYGPDPDQFYSLGADNRDGVALQFAGRADKGSDLMGIIVPALIKSGFRVTAFGEPAPDFSYDDRVVQIGFASPTDLRRLFQRSEFFIDSSHYEGLGMLPLEALFCGAIPVLTRNGGSSEIIGSSSAGVLLDGISSLHRIGEMLRLIDRGDERFEIGRQHVMRTHNLVAAVNAIIGCLE